MLRNQLLLPFTIRCIRDMIMPSRLLRHAGLMFVVAIVWLGGFSTPMALGAVDNVVYQGSFPASTTSGMTHAILTINGTQRDLLIYRPSTAQSLPLLIFFDGTGSDFASIAANDGYFRDFADNWNTIIAVPAQRVMSYGDWDNHSSGTPYFETAVGDSTSSAANSNTDTNPDLLFTRAIIKEASVAYGADLTRVYVNGFSNGAFFSYFVAATLDDKIAAFAETGGGLVLSNTTYGDPTPCAPTASSAATGAVRSCAEAGWTAGLCSTVGAVARPIAPASVSSVPPGFMEANDDDTTVPWAHTCNLANALPVSSSYQVRIVHSGIGHGMNDDYLNNSWNFMKKFSTKTSACTYTLSPASQTFTSAGGTGSVTVTASATSCVWTATSSLSWVTISSGSGGTGNGTVTISVTANTTGATRTGNITIAGKSFAITQSGEAQNNCAATLSDSFLLHEPYFTINGSSLWLDLQYAQDAQFPSTDLMFKLSNAGGVTNLSDYSNCQASALSVVGNNYVLRIPILILGGTSYWLDLTYVPTSDGLLWFKLTGIGGN